MAQVEVAPGELLAALACPGAPAGQQQQQSVYSPDKAGRCKHTIELRKEMVRLERDSRYRQQQAAEGRASVSSRDWIEWILACHYFASQCHCGLRADEALRWQAQLSEPSAHAMSHTELRHHGKQIHQGTPFTSSIRRLAQAVNRVLILEQGAEYIIAGHLPQKACPPQIEALTLLAGAVAAERRTAGQDMQLNINAWSCSARAQQFCP